MASPRFRDDPDDSVNIENPIASATGLDDEPTRKPRWYNSGSKSGNLFARWRQRLLAKNTNERRARRKALCRKLSIVFAVLAFLGICAAIVYTCFVTALIYRLEPPPVNSGLQHIVDEWKEPDANGAYMFKWRNDFSRDIVPKNCHSHNDYWRFVPLYQALSSGCVSIEADIWLDDDNELRVSHTWKYTTKERTLRSLYLDPLGNILANRNVSVASTENKEVGIFDRDPNVSVILLIDFKTDGHDIWPVLLSQLEPLRERNWLTYFDGKRVIQGPLTIVGTGNTPFELVEANNSDRYIFFDAPLDDIANLKYTSDNSYYASVQMRKAIGRLWFNRFTSKQVEILKTQIKAAADKGLVSRYWDTPSWPISLRDKVWLTLTENDVGMLNVDDLISATRWNWNWCIVAGIRLCGNS